MFTKATPRVRGQFRHGLVTKDYAAATLCIPNQSPSLPFGAKPLVFHFFCFTHFNLLGKCPLHLIVYYVVCCAWARFLCNLILPRPFLDPSTALRQDFSQPRAPNRYSQGRLELLLQCVGPLTHTLFNLPKALTSSRTPSPSAEC